MDLIAYQRCALGLIDVARNAEAEAADGVIEEEWEDEEEEEEELEQLLEDMTMAV